MILDQDSTEWKIISWAVDSLLLLHSIIDAIIIVQDPSNLTENFKATADSVDTLLNLSTWDAAKLCFLLQSHY